MSKPVLLTGLRSNNDLHIGNYLGAMLPMADMAKQHAGEYQVNLFIPDLHSFTTPIDHTQLYEQTLNTVKMNVAAGLPLDQEDIYVYRQSFIPAHSELTWILSCFTYFGEMSRMTQFKDKAKNLAREYYKKRSSLEEALANVSAQEESNKKDSLTEKKDKFVATLRDLDKFDLAEEFEGIYMEQQNKLIKHMENEIDLYTKLEEETTTLEKASVGLFNYPILMAADILLYGAEYVPVGDDQTQHLEFTRDIAERMNSRFGELFTVPKPVKEQHALFGKDQGLRIRDLIDPTKKMSKSDETRKGVLFLNDSPDDARKKIKGATTDSLGEVQYDYGQRPGVSNLIDILTLLGGDPEQFIGHTQYGPLKDEVAEKVADFLQDFQSRLNDLDEKTIENKLNSSEKQMQEVADQRLHDVQQAIGLRE